MSITPVAAQPAPVTAAPDQQYLHPGLRPDVAEERLRQGRIAEYQLGELDPGVIDRGAPNYFRTTAEIHKRLGELQAKYPDLVQVQDIGDSSDKARGTGGADIIAIRLGNQKSPIKDRPSSFWIAGEHAREIANPELMMRFVEDTLAGYGTDPEATALLDTREINIVPVQNPDGHAEVEKAYNGGSSRGLMHRKNTTAPDGTDLNRNYDYKWGGPGASSSPYSQTYRGAAAASEAETKAVQDFARNTKPGMFIDWHSYSELVLYPWGFTRDRAPDHEGLKNIAERFATYNHYTPKQSINLYPTSGTSKDFTYGELGIPSFTIETGKTFHMNDKAFEGVYAENKPVMQYAAKIADAPYERVKGPDALDVHVDLDAGKLQATISDRLAGGQTIAGAEAILDPTAKPGTGVSLLPADGKFDSAEERVAGDMAGLLAAVEAERQLVYVRALDSGGNWGPTTAQWLQHPSFGSGTAPAEDAAGAAAAAAQ